MMGEEMERRAEESTGNSNKLAGIGYDDARCAGSSIGHRRDPDRDETQTVVMAQSAAAKMFRGTIGELIGRRWSG